MALEVRVIDSVTHLEAALWDRFVGGAGPTLEHAFLRALEVTQCLGERAGWLSQHLVAYEAGEVVGIAPAFVKTHSYGEFVYDWAWADAAARGGISYYPKLILAAPFTPVTGTRLGSDSPVVRQALLAAACELAEHLELSGVHLLFGEPEEMALASSLGFSLRLGCQFHWRNEGYRDFQDFLDRFDSKRRNQIKRERRKVREQGFEVVHASGRNIPAEWCEPAFTFYGATVDSFVWGKRYLNWPFFQALWAEVAAPLQMTVALQEGELIAGALNFEGARQGQRRRFGRYWGSVVEADALHFEVCAYAAIEDCISHGVAVFEAGAGGERHKLSRGFLPAETWSAHWFREPRLHAAVSDFCERERAALQAEMEHLRTTVFTR